VSTATATAPFDLVLGDARGDQSGEVQRPRKVRAVEGVGDRIFTVVTRISGFLVLVIVGAIGVFLTTAAMPALRKAGFAFLTTQAWQPDIGRFGIAGVLVDTILIAVIAVIVATPISILAALFITEICPERMRRLFVTLVDLMAAVPSVVYAIFGLFYFQGALVPVARFLATWFSWIPLFHVPGVDVSNPNTGGTPFSASTFVVAILVAIMIVPIQTAIMRESFRLAPLGEREGAYALGSTRWGMIRSVVLPFGRGGMIGGTMLALGRALGETIVVYLIISPVFTVNWHVLATGGNSISALIALNNGEASPFGRAALMAAGLALFATTLVINFIAAAIVSRSRSGAESDV
jgi:phosphate transport system permease protein